MTTSTEINALDRDPYLLRNQEAHGENLLSVMQWDDGHCPLLQQVLILRREEIHQLLQEEIHPLDALVRKGITAELVRRK